MWRNYFLVAARSLAKNRLFTALNLAGLAVGMAACLLVVTGFIQHEQHNYQTNCNARRKPCHINK